MVLGFGKSWNPRGKHCLVTGGSTGLGLALSTLLAQEGAATVSIVARNEDNLKAAVKQLESNRNNPEQVFRYHSFPLNTAAGARSAVEAECTALAQQSDGKVEVPDCFFFCAGASYPRFWVESTEEQIVHAFDQAYWVQAWTAHAAMKKLAAYPNPGAKIVFVGSTCSLLSFVGFATYSPGKFALRGLAETLRSEGILYGVDVQIFYAPTMRSPGLETENRTKPAICKKFEEDDEVLECGEAAKKMLDGVKSGSFHFGATFLGKVFINSTRGATPNPNPILGPFYDCISWIGMPIWRRDCDSQIVKHREEHRVYLEGLGLAGTSSKKTD